MPIVRLPSQHDTSYPAPRGPALVVSCMDLRLLDEIVQFLDHDALTNRYDHLTIAGAALGALGGPKGKKVNWKETFWEHVDIAYDLRKFKDVYIIEHRDCGAYEKFLGKDGKFNDSQLASEEKCHRKYAGKLEKAFQQWKVNRDPDMTLVVKSFLMDLRGGVTLL